MARSSAAEAPAPRVRPHPDRSGITRPRRRPVPRRQVRGGIVWIVVLAVLLSGVVAMNVAVLRLNVRLDKLSGERAKLRADNAQLASQLSSAASAPLIQALARNRLGLVPAQATDTTYVELGRPAK